MGELAVPVHADLAGQEHHPAGRHGDGVREPGRPGEPGGVDVLGGHGGSLPILRLIDDRSDSGIRSILCASRSWVAVLAACTSRPWPSSWTPVTRSPSGSATPP